MPSLTPIPKTDREILYAQKQMLEEERRKKVEGLPHLYGWPWYAWAKEFHDSYARMKLMVAANQISKFLCDYEELPTPTGFRKVIDIEVGDFIYSWDGVATKVVDIPFEGDDECFEFEFDDGTSIVSSKDHMWWAKGYGERFRKRYTSNGATWENPEYGKWNLYSTEDIFEKGGYGPEAKATKRFAIPICEPVEYVEKDLPDPYMLGLLLGDGCFRGRGLSLCNPEKEIGAYITRMGGSKMDTKGCPTYYCGFFKDAIRSLGLDDNLSKDKYIPEDYLTASIQQRKDLLAGLMDTDGAALKHGVYYYSTISERLKDGVVELVASLGGKTRVKLREAGYKKDGVFHRCNDCYEVCVITNFNPFRLAKHKVDRWHLSRYKLERVIRKVTPVGKKRGRCFTVSDRRGSFLASKNYIVTHNSSTQIRMIINWCTNPDTWQYISNRTPRLFWYLYPTQDVIKTEIDTKWIPEFLPRGEFKDHPQYGWDIDRTSKAVEGIQFKAGPYLQFKTYGQGAKVLQTSTLDAICCDEELPENLYDELNARLIASDGIFSMVFTATLGQEMWWRAMEAKGDQEIFKDALKMNISMYDCLYYKDGTRSTWSEEKIEKIKRSCKSKAEVLRRVYGRFVREEGKKYPAFDPDRHFIPPFEIPTSYRLYAGVDIGSGGGEGHPAAIIWLAVSPDNKKGYIMDGWRGDLSLTTNGDILSKFRRMKYSRPLNKYTIVSQVYDHQAKDFHTIATRNGEPFTQARKNQEEGEAMVNTLLKCNMLFVFDTEELRKLGSEMMSLLVTTAKTKAKDDFCDATRFSVMSVPWDWSEIEAKDEEEDVNEKPPEAELSEAEVLEMQIRERRGEVIYDDDDEWGVGGDIDEWNEAYGG